MKSAVPILAATTAITLISACGGGGDSAPSNPIGNGGTQLSSPNYETLRSNGEVTSTLGGIALRALRTTGALDIVATSGTMTHNTRNTTITDGTYSLTDPDGFDNFGRLTDGTSVIISDENQGFTGDYEYVMLYEQSYTFEGTTYDSAGIVGVITSAPDVPKSGNATFTGEGVGSVVTATQSFNLNDGTSFVSVDFAGGTVNVTLAGFTATDQATGNLAVAPIDSISITGMTIARNGFGGGTVTTYKDGAAVNVTGANTTTTAQGAFFGYNGAQTAISGTIAAPDEVGGLILLLGDDGIVSGGYIAD